MDEFSLPLHSIPLHNFHFLFIKGSNDNSAVAAFCLRKNSDRGILQHHLTVILYNVLSIEFGRRHCSSLLFVHISINNYFSSLDIFIAIISIIEQALEQDTHPYTCTNMYTHITEHTDIHVYSLIRNQYAQNKGGVLNFGDL
ncbi:Ribosome-binding factor [Dirofilaria immitis]